MQVKVYYNPRCNTCRNVLSILKRRNTQYELVEYLKRPPSEKEIVNILDLLKVKQKEILRKNEKKYKELRLEGKELSREEVARLIANYPILLQRPILIIGGKAVIGRPVEEAKRFLIAEA